MKKSNAILGAVSFGAMAFALQQAGAQTPAPAASGTASVAAAPAADGGASDVSVGDIVVTAQKRRERLQDVPISLNAATGDQLRSLGVTNTDQLQKLVPGFTFQKTVYGNPVYYIRGIGFNENTLGIAPAVSVYVDQQPLPFTPMARGAVLDLERVEVLKGPQGTLFGENSTGGAVNYIAAKPTSNLQAGLDLTYGRFNQLDAEAFVSGPVSDTLSVRVAARNEYQSDWQKGYTTSESIGEKRFSSGRLTIAWKPVSSVRIELTASGWRDDSDTQQPQLIAYTPLLTGPAARPLPFPISTFPPAPNKPRAAAWDPARKFTRDDYFYQFGGRAEVDLTDSITLTSLTSYARYKQDILIDIDATTYASGVSDDPGRIRSFSQELRVNGSVGDNVKWMLGGNYESDRVFERLILDPLITSGTAIGPFPYDAAVIDNDQRIKSKSGFGSIDLDVSPTLTLQASARYTKQDRDFEGCARDNGSGQLSAGVGFLATLITGSPQTLAPGACLTLTNGVPTGIVRGKLDQDNISWRGSINWKPNRDTLIYANVTKGFKAGSFPTLPSLLAEQFKGVTQESVLAYEAGAKASFWDHKAELSGAAFYYDYQNKQLLGYYVDPVFGSLPALVSIPKATVKGAELSLVVRPLSGLSLSVNGTYIDTRVDRNPPNPTGPYGSPGSFVGQRFPYTPKWQGTVDAQYRFGVATDLFAFLGGSATGRTSTEGSLFSGDPSAAALEKLLHIRGYTLVDLRAGIEPADSAWRLELWARNITNKFYEVSVSKNSDFTTRFVGAPATYGISLHYRFAR